MVVDVKAALLSRQQKTETDRAHVKRWLAVANDPVWQKVAIEFAANIKTVSEEELFTVVIEAALRFRRYAENARYETAELIREREQKKQKHRQKLLSLASNIEDIVGRLRRDRINWAPFSRDPNSPSNLEARQSLEWLEREIKFIRRSTKPEIFDSGKFVPITVSRQSGGRGKHPRSRAIGLFIRHLTNVMISHVGRPRYDYVARLTNVAFRGLDVGAEDVRQHCRPRKGGTLSGKKAPKALPEWTATNH